MGLTMKLPPDVFFERKFTFLFVIITPFSNQGGNFLIPVGGNFCIPADNVYEAVAKYTVRWMDWLRVVLFPCRVHEDTSSGDPHQSR